MQTRHRLALGAGISLTLAASVAGAQQEPSAASEAPAAAPAAAAPAKPPPYSLPWGLRGAIAGTSLRAETAYALFKTEPPGGASLDGATLVQYLSASYKLVPDAAVFARAGWVHSSVDSLPSGSAFTNLALGGIWTPKVGENLRIAPAFGVGLPIGQGGGDTPDPQKKSAIAAGSLARSRLDGSSMFSPNDIAPFVGLDAAYISGGFTLQAEVTIFELIRARGSGDASTDSKKTSLTTGLHVGYFFLPMLSAGVELRDQTFVSTPKAVDSGATKRSWITLAAGPRAHFKLGDSVWFRPGIAFVQPLTDPSPAISASKYHVVQLDLPLAF